MVSELKIVFIVSTKGALLTKLLEHNEIRERTYSVVSDRRCDALLKAERHNLQVHLLQASDGGEFSKKLDQQFYDKNIVFVSMYTKLLTPQFLKGREGMVFNCHPSILPACKGLSGFSDTLDSNSMFIGCTLHEITNDLDGGRSVIQGAMPLDRKLSFHGNRHKVFLMQYYSLLQFFKWILEGKLSLGEHWSIQNVRFKQSMFSPNLDNDFFEKFDVDNELNFNQ